MLLVVHQRRARADLLRTKLLIEVQLAVASKTEAKLGETYQQMVDLLFPYLARAGQEEKQKAVDMLRSWTSKVLTVRPLWKASGNRRLVSRLRKGAERAQQLEGKLRGQKKLN